MKHSNQKTWFAIASLTALVAFSSLAQTAGQGMPAGTTTGSTVGQAPSQPAPGSAGVNPNDPRGIGGGMYPGANTSGAASNGFRGSTTGVVATPNPMNSPYASPGVTR